MGLKDGVIQLGFQLFGATRLHRVAQKYAQGLGAILMFHRVRPKPDAAFQPNSGLEITPEYLDLILTRLSEEGYQIVSLDEAAARISAGRTERPFVALTFDDGYRDTLEIAAPILLRHNAPYTVFITTGFADQTARMWWVEMEEAIKALDRICFDFEGLTFDLPTQTTAEKQEAFRALYWLLRGGAEDRLLRATSALAGQADVDISRLSADLCLDWDGVRALARDRLCTIGAHTKTHPMLAKHDAAFMRAEMAESCARIAAELGRKIEHFAYPVGDPGSAGPREFEFARELGLKTAVTTRPGMVFAEHGAHLTALPRLSVNGHYQSWAALDILLSGAPFLIWNRGRKVSVA
jgi:peptidoglycan/xylan/chitin deacetylase (PgdA/CDA1 family)